MTATVTLKINTDNRGAVSGIQVVKRELGGLGSAAQSASGKARPALDQIKVGVDSIRSGLVNAKAMMLGFGASIASVQGARALARIADQYTNITSKLRTVTDAEGELTRVRTKNFEIAQLTRQAFGATSELYTRLTRSTENLALAEGSRLRIVETINKGMVVSGATTQEASAAIIQLSQGLAAGALRGEEFNSVAEQAPIIMDMLSKSLGVTRGELRAMAQDGELTAGVLVGALLEGGRDVDALFAEMALTIGGASTLLDNAFVKWVGEADKALGVSKLVAGAISELAENIDTAAAVVILIASAWGVKYVVAITSAVLASNAKRAAAVALAAAELNEARAAEAAAVAQLAKAQAMALGGASAARAAAAETALAAAQARTAFATAASTAAMAANTGMLARMGSGLLALVGGPYGAAVLAIGGIAYALHSASEAEREREREVREGIDATVTATKHVNELADAMAGLNSMPPPPLKTYFQETAIAAAQLVEQQRALVVEQERLQNLQRQAQFAGSSMRDGAGDRSGMLDASLAAQTELVARQQSAIDGLNSAYQRAVAEGLGRFSPAMDVATAAVQRFMTAGSVREGLSALVSGMQEVASTVDGIRAADATAGRLFETIKGNSASAAEELGKVGKSATELAQAMVSQAVESARVAGWRETQIALLEREGEAYIATTREIERLKNASKLAAAAKAAEAVKERERERIRDREIDAINRRTEAERGALQLIRQIQADLDPLVAIELEYEEALEQVNDALFTNAINLEAALTAANLLATRRKADVEQVRKQTATYEDYISALEEEVEVLGMTRAEAEEYRIVQEGVNRAIADGLPVTDAMIAQLRSLASAMNEDELFQAQIRFGETLGNTLVEMSAGWLDAEMSVEQFGQTAMAMAEDLSASITDLMKKSGGLKGLFNLNSLGALGGQVGMAIGTKLAEESKEAAIGALVGMVIGAVIDFYAGGTGLFTGMGAAVGGAVGGLFAPDDMYSFSTNLVDTSESMHRFEGQVAVSGAQMRELNSQITDLRDSVLNLNLSEEERERILSRLNAMGPYQFRGDEFDPNLILEEIQARYIASLGFPQSAGDDPVSQELAALGEIIRQSSEDVGEQFQNMIDLFDARAQFNARGGADFIRDAGSVLTTPTEQMLEAVNEDFEAVIERRRAELLAAGYSLAVVEQHIAEMRASWDETMAGYASSVASEATLGFAQFAAVLVELRHEGESFADAYARVRAETMLLAEAFDLLGYTFRGTITEFIRFASEFVELAGGIDRASELWTAFFRTFYSELEGAELNLGAARRNADQELADVGLSGDIDPAEFRTLFEAVRDTLSPEELLEWLEAGEAIGVVLDAEEQLRLARERQAETALETARFYEDMAGEAAGMSDFQSEIRGIRRAFDDAVQDANDLARAAGRAGASQQELAAIHRWTASQVQAAVGRLMSAARQLAGELFGFGLDAIEEQIAEIEGAQSAAYQSESSYISDIGEQVEDRYAREMRALAKISDYVDSLLLNENLTTLTPQERLAEAQSQFQAALAAAQGGDLTALENLPGLAQEYLEQARFFFASGDDYQDIFGAVTGALNALVEAGPQNDPLQDQAPGSGIGSSVVAVTVTPELQALYEQRDAALAEQEAEYRRTMAEDFAVMARDIAAASGLSVVEVIGSLGGNLEDLAIAFGADLENMTAESVSALGSLATTLGLSMGQLLQQLGIPLTAIGPALTELAQQTGINVEALTVETAGALGALLQGLGISLHEFAAATGLDVAEGITHLVESMGISLDDLSAAQVQQLAALAGTLGVSLSNVAHMVGVDLGELADSQSLLNQALEAEINGLPEEHRDALRPLLDNLENATDEGSARVATEALHAYVNSLPAGMRAQLAPYFEDIPDAQTYTDLDYLETINTASQAQLGYLSDIELVLRGIRYDLSGQSGTGGLGGGSGVPSYDVGTAYVPRDGLAILHQGETVLTVPEANLYRAGRLGSSKGDSTATVAMLDEFRAMRAELAELKEELRALRETSRDGSDKVARAVNESARVPMRGMA